MDSKEYLKSALKTESYDLDKISPRTENIRSMRLIHASLGMQTESAEFSDTIKKYIFYGKPLDITNLKEEIGDMLWYVAIALDSLDSSFEEVMGTNIKKLKARYGEKFSEESAITRNLTIERAILEE